MVIVAKDKKKTSQKDQAKPGQRLFRLGLLGVLLAIAWLVWQSLTVAPITLPRLTGPVARLLEEKDVPGVETLDLAAILGEEASFSGLKEEPIAAPVVGVQSQAQLLIEMIKKLPENQVKAVKEQLCKELCGE